MPILYAHYVIQEHNILNCHTTLLTTYLNITGDILHTIASYTYESHLFIYIPFDMCQVKAMNMSNFWYKHIYALCKFVYNVNTTTMDGATTFKVNVKTCELIFRCWTLFLSLGDTASNSHSYGSSIKFCGQLFYANLETEYHSFPSS
jgi:hypothetical protein